MRGIGHCKATLKIQGAENCPDGLLQKKGKQFQGDTEKKKSTRLSSWKRNRPIRADPGQIPGGRSGIGGLCKVRRDKKGPSAAGVPAGQSAFGFKGQDSVPAQTLSAAYCEGEGEQAGRVWCQSPPPSGRRAHLYRQTGFQCLQ